MATSRSNDGSPSTPPDPVERLLEPIVGLDDPAERRSALERICSAHPGLERDLRSRFELWETLLAAEPAPDEAPVRFGDYELIRPLGSGGMGIVWLARQRLTSVRTGDAGPAVVREVALKMIRDRGLFSHEARERFRREAQAALRVEHPGICPVYDVGEHDGTPYLAMRNVPGRPLSAHLAQAIQRGEPLELPDPGTSSTSSTVHGSGGGGGGSSTSRAQARRRLATTLRFVERAARALHEAHEAGLVHRDVKPGNLMVTPHGDPVVLDFGLARDDTAEEQALTVTGSPVGTPAYMAPEQISPDGRRIDRGTDVHALGATLYQCLTLRPPFAADTREELYLRILHDAPPKPSRLDRNLPRDLDVVIETAMRKEPARRYATALDFAEDLRRVRERQPIHARPTGPLLRARLWAQRNPLVSVVLVLLLASQVAIAWQSLAVAEQARIARDEGRRADRRAHEASEARLAADRQAEEARRSSARAESALTDARAAVQQLVDAAQQQLRDLPAVEDVRGELIEAAIRFHQHFLDRYGDEPRLQRDAGLSRLAAGELLLELGRYSEGMALLEQSRTVFAQAAAANPEDALAAYDTGRACHLLALGHRALGHPESGREELEAAARHKRTGLELVGPAPSYAVSLTVSLGALADAYRESGDDEAALAHCSEILRLLEGIDAPLDDDTRRNAIESRAAALRVRGRVWRDRGEGARALEDFEASLAAYRELMATERRPSRETRSSYSATLMAAAIEERRARHPEMARDMLVEACEVLESLHEDFPGNLQVLRSLATAWNNRATVERQAGQEGPARAALQRALEIQDRLIESNEEVFDAHFAKAMTLYNLGNLERGDLGMAAANQRYHAAAAALEPWSEDPRCAIDGLQLASRIATNLAVSFALLGRGEEADLQFDRAITLSERILARDPDSLRTRGDLARLLHNRGVRARETGDARRATQVLTRSLELRTELSRAGSERRIEPFVDRLATASQLTATLHEAGDAARCHELATSETGWFDTLDTSIRESLLEQVRVRVDLAGMTNDALATRNRDRASLTASRPVDELLAPVFANGAATPRTFAERWRALLLAWEDTPLDPAADARTTAIREAIPDPIDWSEADPLVQRELRSLAERTERILRLNDRDAGDRTADLRALLDTDR